MEKNIIDSLSRSTILIVDDNYQNSLLLKNIFKNRYKEVIVKENGAKAIEYVTESKPDIILLDISLPDIDGFVVCKKIKSNNLLKNIPIIFISAFTDSEFKLKAFEVGAIDYIIKPIEVQEVIARVETHLKMSFFSNFYQKSKINIENQFNHIFDQLAVGIAYVSYEGEIFKVNNKFCKILDYSENELITRNIVEFIEEEFVDKEIESIRKLTNGDYESYSNEFIAIRKDGSNIWARVKVTKGKDLIKDKKYIIGVVEDITERKENECKILENESRLKQSQKIAKLGNWELDLVNNELFWSDEIYSIFELDKNKFTPSYELFLEKIHPKDRDMVSSAYENHLKNKIEYKIVHRLELEDKTIKYVEENCKTEFDIDGNPLISFGTVQDITQEIRNQNKIKELNEKLEEKVKERTKALEDSLKVLKESNNEIKKLSKAIEHSPISIVITNEKGDIEYVNPKFEEITGYKKIEIIGKNPKILKSGLMDEEIYKNLWSKISKGEEWKGDIQNRKKNGQLYWESSIISPIFDRDNNIINYIGLKEDITEDIKLKKRLNEIKIRYDMIFNSSNDALFIFNKKYNKFIEINEKSINLSGLSKLELLNVSPDDLFEYDLNELKKLGVSENVNKIDFISVEEELSKGNVVHEMKIKYKTKYSIPIEVISYFFNYEDNRFILILARDIIERKINEKRLIKSKKEAESANELKSMFLANMSHEIRTPMTAIIGLSQITLNTDLNEKQKKYLESIHRSSKNLLGIINDILDISKIEAGKLQLEKTEFELDNVLIYLKDVLLIKAQEKQISFKIIVDDNVEKILIGDPLRLGQVLLNLCNNAVKFTEKGFVELRIDFIKKSESVTKLKFSVTDTGIGLTEKQINNLFKSFQQGDISTTRKYGGSGLGLSITKNIVELMNGKIDVISESGKGSTFFFIVDFERKIESNMFLNKNDIGFVKENSNFKIYSYKGIDVDKGLRISNKNSNLYKELLFKFKEKYSEFYKKSLNLLENDKNRELKIMIHSLNGVSKNLAFYNLEKIVEKVEKGFEYFEDLKKKEYLGIINEELQWLFKYIYKLEIEEKNKKVLKNNVYTKTEIRSFLDELLNPLQIGKVSEIKKVIKKYKDTIFPEEYKKEFDDLLEKTKRYNYFEAIDLLEKLRNKLSQGGQNEF